MKGSEIKLLEYMTGSRKRFVIPVYQRNYEWKLENCKQLYDDLVAVIRNERESHFFGSLVSSYIPSGRYTEYLVIDGQQRLTTVSLLLLAMHNLLNQGKMIAQTETLAQEIFEDYLVDKHQPKETRIKLKPVKNDQSAFGKLFDDESEYVRNSNLTLNYTYFYNRIQKEEITIDQLYDALYTLEIINIELTPVDNPQLIFESLNSTGVALSEGDKIRNFILMGLNPKEQADYYENYWNKIEICTNYDVSLFVRDYLSVKQQMIPAINKVYFTFKAYVQDANVDTETLLKELLAYAKWYEILLKGSTEDRQLNACIYRLNRLENTTTRPFFLEVLRLHAAGTLTISDVRYIFLVTENYLFRRAICDLPTNVLNKVFLVLHREIIRFDGTEDNYVSKFKYALLSKSERGRFPEDAEFINAFSTRQIYQMNSKNKIYILERFENYGTIEDKDVYRHFDSGDYSIEHIMPQHLTPVWIKSLGEDYETIHEQWLHRMANLTLTGYNSKYSNSSFAEKRDTQNGFRESGLRMNAWIAQQETWTLSELEKRDQILMGRALNIWALPTTDFIPEQKQMDSYTLDDDVDLSGRDIVRFSYKNAEQPVSSWVAAMEQILKILHEEDHSVLSLLAYSKDTQNELGAYVSNQPRDLRRSLKIDTDIHVECNTSTRLKLSLLRKFFKEYGANPEDLVFYLRSEADDRTAEEAGTRYELRRRYWAFALPYIQQAHGEGGSFSNSTSSKENWMSGFFGIGGFNIACVANYNKARVDLTFAHTSKERNKEAFDYLYGHKVEIEAALGSQVSWQRSDDTKGSYIVIPLEGVSIENEADWVQMAKFHAEWSKKFYDVFVPYLQKKF